MTSLARYSFVGLLLLSTCLFSASLYAHQNSRAFGTLTLQADSETDAEQRIATLSLAIRYDDWSQLINLDSNDDGHITREELQPQAGFISRTIVNSVRAFNNGQPCAGVVAAPDLGVRHGSAYIISEVRFQCPQPLQKFTLSYGLFKTLHPGHRLLTKILSGGKEFSRALVTDPQQDAEYTLEVSAPRASLLNSLAEFVKLGLEHIITGYDHILFLIALVIMGGTLLELVKLATAFTLAHSITLAMAALQWVSLPAHIVEPIIALSIVLVAIENLVFHNRLARLRLSLALLFGLVHGFGFASALMALDISHENIVVPLLGFNLGVEAGQLMFVALLYPLLRWLGDKTYKVQVVRLASVAIMVIGMWWLIERTIMI